MYPYFSEYPFGVRLLFKPGKPIRHHQECPVCKKKLVNIYLRGGVWKCKQCWDSLEIKFR